MEDQAVLRQRSQERTLLVAQFLFEVERDRDGFDLYWRGRRTESEQEASSLDRSASNQEREPIERHLGAGSGATKVMDDGPAGECGTERPQLVIGTRRRCRFRSGRGRPDIEVGMRPA